MGVLCQSCNILKLKLEEEEKPYDATSQTDIILPRQYVSATDENLISLEEIANYADKQEKLKVKAKSMINKKIEENDNKVNKNYSKSKSQQIIERKNRKCQSVKLILGDKKKEIKNEENLINRREKRSNSQTKSKKLENFDYEKLLIENMKKKQNESDNNKYSGIKNRSTFKRKAKKSATLMENSKILKQLFTIQMSIPVSSELLVLHQKGNPSDKYIRGKKLGNGTFGVVYEAKNIQFNNTVAMKIIKKEENMNQLIIKNEIDILKKLSHPNIVRIYEFYESSNNFYLINEYCDGGELFYYINKKNLSEQQLSIIFYQVFSGLCYLHENKILHRDMKPENILISKKEPDLYTKEEYFWIQIIDFGTAKIFEHNKKEKSIVGSAYYIAPEVLDKNYNEKCDTWSVGIILYMFLSGRAPFDGKSNEEIINSIKTTNLDLKNERLLKHSPEVIDLINGLLEKDIKKRLSAKEALNHEWFKKFNGRKLFANFKQKDIEPYIENLFNYSFHSKIQQLVIAFLVHNLPTTDSSRNILKLYRFFNLSGDCKLTKEELIKGLSEYRFEEEVRKKVDTLFVLLDSDNNGYIEYEEFLRACIDKKEILTEEYLKYAYKFLDKEGKGNLSVEEINKAFLKEENKLFEIALSQDINDVDIDGDGNINFQEFKILMTNTMNNIPTH